MSEKNKINYVSQQNKKERSVAEYISLFSGRCDNIESLNIPNDRHEKLYNLSKYKKQKDEQFRQKMQEKRAQEELAECTFAPKINKSYKKRQQSAPKHIHKSSSNNYVNKLIEPDPKYSEIFKRQTDWADGINKRNLLIKQKEENKDIQRFSFVPEINKKCLKYLKTDTQNIVKDPESYKEYIDMKKRIQKENLIKNNNNNKNLANIKINNKINKDYDYTKHLLTNQKKIKDSNGNTIKGISPHIIKKSKNFYENNEIIKKSVPLNKMKVTNMDDNEFYSMIYLDAKEKYEKKMNVGFSEEEKINIFNGRTQLEFKEALDIIHDKLIHLDILSDDDENEEENNNNKLDINVEKQQNEI